MENQFNFKIISDLPLSKICRQKHIYTFIQLAKYIQLLPYGRTKNRSDFYSIINEQKGTCSTKHAFLKAVSIENNQPSVTLHIGIYKMNALNTTGIESILRNNMLDYIPEAHTYLKINGNILDITRNIISKKSFETTLLIEIKIEPNQIDVFKENYHKNYIKKWIIKKNVLYNFHYIWEIRESCIIALSKKT